jgi:channel protein (hemolysin III family)
MNEYGIQSIAGFAEPLSSWTHLLGAVVFAILAVPLLRRAARSGQSRAEVRFRFATVAIFAVSVVVLLAISGMYHRAPFSSQQRTFLLRLDYAAIFVLIAGTFTPACGILFEGVSRWAWIGVIWAAAFVGIFVKTLYPAAIPSWLGIVLYLAMGWVGILAAIDVWRRYGASFLEYLLLGGCAYTVGAAVMLAARPAVIPGVVGPHELFHAAVLSGIGFHWVFIYQLADGQLPQRLRWRIVARRAAEQRAVHREAIGKKSIRRQAKYPAKDVPIPGSVLMTGQGVTETTTR